MHDIKKHLTKDDQKQLGTWTKENLIYLVEYQLNLLEMQNDTLDKVEYLYCKAVRYMKVFLFLAGVFFLTTSYLLFFQI